MCLGRQQAPGPEKSKYYKHHQDVVLKQITDRRKILLLFEPDFNIILLTLFESCLACLLLSLMKEAYTFWSQCACIHLQNCLCPHPTPKLYLVLFLRKSAKQETSCPSLCICFCLHFSLCLWMSYHFICWVLVWKISVLSLTHKGWKQVKITTNRFRFSWGKKKKTF